MAGAVAHGVYPQGALQAPITIPSADVDVPGHEGYVGGSNWRVETDVKRDGAGRLSTCEVIRGKSPSARMVPAR